MEITFADRKLERTFNSEKELIKAYGAETARVIMRRMAVLQAATTLDEVPHKPPERRRQLLGDRKGQFAVDAKGAFRIVFEPNHDPVPLKDDGGIDLKRITAIIILGVEDYH